MILICHEGCQSSLAAAALRQFGLIHATDLDGGFTAWIAADLPVITAPWAGYLTRTGEAVGEDGSVAPVIGGLPRVDLSPHPAV